MCENGVRLSYYHFYATLIVLCVTCVGPFAKARFAQRYSHVAAKGMKQLRHSFNVTFDKALFCQGVICASLPYHRRVCLPRAVRVTQARSAALARLEAEIMIVTEVTTMRTLKRDPCTTAVSSNAYSEKDMAAAS